MTPHRDGFFYIVHSSNLGCHGLGPFEGLYGLTHHLSRALNLASYDVPCEVGN